MIGQEVLVQEIELARKGGSKALEKLFFSAWPPLHHYEQRITTGAVWLSCYPLESLAELAKRAPHLSSHEKSVSLIDSTVNLLAAFATKGLSNLVEAYGIQDANIWRLITVEPSTEDRKRAADTLSLILLKFEEDDLIPFQLVQALMKSVMSDNLSGEPKFLDLATLILSGLSMRVLLGDRVHLSEFKNLIDTPDLLESEYQSFLSQHPFLLDPLFAEVWPQARLGESLQADFVIKRMDNSLLVVEIERPDTAFFTTYPQLTAAATHAVTQAISYRDWLVKNQLYCRDRFGDFSDVEALAVLGRESDLTASQKDRLRMENEARRGAVKIVGFDWLANRASAITRNAISAPFNRLGLR